jgi:predicted transposase/invertase (TIGR01784 family)
MAKKIFGNKDDIEPIKLLLKLILDLNVKKIEVLNNELIDRPYIDKKNSVDLLVELDDNTVVGIEINTDVSSKLIERNVFYMARIMSMDLSPNEDYDKLKYHIQLNFDLEGHHERPIMKYKFMDEERLTIKSQ